MVFAAAARREDRERQGDVQLAWLIAAMMRARRLPSLKKLLRHQRPGQRLQGAELERRQREFSELRQRLVQHGD